MAKTKALAETTQTETDIVKFDKAKEQVELSKKALAPFEEINDNNEKEQALETLKAGNTVVKLIEDKRKELVKPYNDTVKKINSYAKELTEGLESKITTVKQSVLDFQKKEGDRLKSERLTNRKNALESLGFALSEDRLMYYNDVYGNIPVVSLELFDDAGFVGLLDNVKEALALENSKKQLESSDDFDLLAAFGDEDEIEEVKNQQATFTAPVAAHYTATGTASELKGVTKRWTFEVEDTSLVPHEYLQVDEAAIREAIKNGTRSIPGIKIFQKESLTLR